MHANEGYPGRSDANDESSALIRAQEDAYKEEGDYRRVADKESLVQTTLQALSEAESVQNASSGDDSDEENAAAGALLAGALSSNTRELEYA